MLHWEVNIKNPSHETMRSTLHQYLISVLKSNSPKYLAYLWKYELRNGCLLNLEGDTEAQSHLKAIRHEAHI